MAVAGNVMKALICTLVDDAVHYSTDDDDGVRRAEHVRNPSRDNTDRSKTDTKTCLGGDHLRSVVGQNWSSVNCRTASGRRSGSFAAFQARSAAASVDCCRSSRRARRWCFEAAKSLLCDAFPAAGGCCLPRRRSESSMRATRPNATEPRDVGSACALEATSTTRTLNRNANTRTMHFDSGEPAWFPHY